MLVGIVIVGQLLKEGHSASFYIYLLVSFCSNLLNFIYTDMEPDGRISLELLSSFRHIFYHYILLCLSLYIKTVVSIRYFSISSDFNHFILVLHLRLGNVSEQAALRAGWASCSRLNPSTNMYKGSDEPRGYHPYLSRLVSTSTLLGGF